RPKANSGAAAVHRRKTCAQHGDFLTEIGRLAIVGLLKQLNTVLYALEIRARNNFIIGTGHGIRDVAASSDKDGIVLLQQIGEHYITSNPRVVMHFNDDILHILIAL